MNIAYCMDAGGPSSAQPTSSGNSLPHQTVRSLALQDEREREMISLVRSIYERDNPPLDEIEYKYMSSDLRNGRTSDSSYSLKKINDELRAQGHDSTLYKRMLARYRKTYGSRVPRVPDLNNPPEPEGDWNE